MGMGVTFLPALYVQSEVAERSDVVAIPLSGTPITRSIGLVWHERSSQAEIFETITSTVRATVAANFTGILLE